MRDRLPSGSRWVALALVVAAAAVGVFAIVRGGPSPAVGPAEVQAARSSWAQARPEVYWVHVTGEIDGVQFGPYFAVDNDEVESQEAERLGLSVDMIFDQMDAALREGAEVKATFNAEFGYPERVDNAGDGRDRTLRTWHFRPLARPAACVSSEGAATDLNAEPAAALAFASYQRWYGVDGCPIRIDVIGHTAGPEHCGWELAEIITVVDDYASPVIVSGSVHRGTVYWWDPSDVIPTLDAARTISASELPAEASDTGFRQGAVELWVAPERGESYRVEGDSVDVLVAEAELACA